MHQQRYVYVFTIKIFQECKTDKKKVPLNIIYNNCGRDIKLSEYHKTFPA